MFTYLILSNYQRPLPLNVTSEVFTKEWRACWEDKTMDLTTLVKMFEPGIEHWVQMLKREKEPDINMITLCRRLSNNPDKAFKKISKWIKWHENLSSVEEHLMLLFIEQIRKVKYYPHQAKPIMAEYVIARDFKNRLSDNIKSSKIQNIDYVDLDPIFNTLYYHPTYPDYLFLRNLGFSKWEDYIFWWVSNRKPINEIASYTHIPFDTFKVEARYICHLVKKTYSESE